MEIAYRSIFESAKKELGRLHESRKAIEQSLAELNQKIEAMVQTINAVAPLLNEQPVEQPFLRSMVEKAVVDLKDLGLTSSMRMVLRKADAPLSPAQIRDVLEEMGWNWADYGNPLSTIHTVLKRLIDTKSVLESVHDDGKRYSWRERPAKKKK